MTRPKEHISAVFPVDIPRIIPAARSFRAVKGKTYTIPFATNHLSLSDLSIKADSNNFTKLEVSKIDDNSGRIVLVTSVDKYGEASSIVTLTDELSGVSATVLVCHTSLVKGLLNIKAEAIGRVISLVWRTEIDSNSGYNYQVIEPQFSLSENIKFKVFYSKDYFNQSYIFKEYKYFNNFQAVIILEQPYSGELIIRFDDLAQGVGGSVLVNVDYQG